MYIYTHVYTCIPRHIYTYTYTCVYRYRYRCIHTHAQTQTFFPEIMFNPKECAIGQLLSSEIMCIFKVEDIMKVLCRLCVLSYVRLYKIGEIRRIVRFYPPSVH